MEKLFINVKDAQSAAYYIAYFTGDSTDHSMDDKIAFLHSESQIATKHHVFGGKKVTINTEQCKFIDGDGNVVVLNIGDDANLYFSKESYCVSGYPYLSNGSCTTSYTAYVPFNTSYTLTQQLTPANTISYFIAADINDITLTGIVLSNDNQQTFSYIYGGDVEIVDGQIPGTNYSSDDINGNMEFPVSTQQNNINIPHVIEESSYILSYTQNAYVCWHQKGNDNVSRSKLTTYELNSEINIIPSTAYYVGNTYPISGAIKWAYSCEFVNHFNIDQFNTYYGWYVVNTKYGSNKTETLGYTPTNFIFALDGDLSIPGGWISYGTINEGGIDYYMYRTKQSGLGNNDWSVKKTK